MGSAVNQSLQIIFGCGNVGDKDTTNGIKLNTPEALQPPLDTFRAHGHNTIDTSRGYPNTNPGGTETLLGTADLTWAHIDTKTPQLNTIYLHFPDRTVPLEQTIPAIASAVLNDQALRWAISNYSVTEVEQIVSICKFQNLPLAHCYQGHYNALTRHAETALLPTLRKHGIAFYAYSTAAGGSFGGGASPSSSTNTSAGGSRIHLQNPVGAITREFYGKPNQQAAIARVRELAGQHGIASGHEVALRWVQHHSALEPGLGDAMVVAASSAAQLEGTLGEVVAAIEKAREAAKETAPEYSPFLEDRKWGDKI